MQFPHIGGTLYYIKGPGAGARLKVLCGVEEATIFYRTFMQVPQEVIVNRKRPEMQFVSVSSGLECQRIITNGY